MNIKALLLDFDGVIRHWSRTHIAEVEGRLRVPEGTLYEKAFTPSLLLPAIERKTTQDVWQSQVETSLASSHGPSVARQLIQAWSTCPSEVDADFLESIERLAQDRGIALVTNATSALPNALTDAGLSDRFRWVFNSSELGVAKPAEGFFAKVVETLRCPPEALLYVDDSEVNVESALKLGFAAHHHTTREATLSFVEERLVRGRTPIPMDPNSRSGSGH